MDHFTWLGHLCHPQPLAWTLAPWTAGHIVTGGDPSALRCPQSTHPPARAGLRVQGAGSGRWGPPQGLVALSLGPSQVRGMEQVGSPPGQGLRLSEWWKMGNTATLKSRSCEGGLGRGILVQASQNNYPARAELTFLA